MTQSYNLSQLANNLNTAGQLDATDGLSGAVPAANGGTGQSAYTVGDILYASGTTALAKLSDVATGNVLISGGVGLSPSYGKVGLTTHISGTLPLANGGTNQTATPAAGSVITGTGTAYSTTLVGTSGQLLISAGTGTPTWAQNAINAKTAVATTSGTSVTFSGIPAGTKRITMMFNGVSTNGTNGYIIQIGSGTIASTGYTSSSTTQAGYVNSYTGGFLSPAIVGANSTVSGHYMLTNISGNIWVGSGVVKNGTGGLNFGAGDCTLTGTLDIIQLITIGAVDTFDAGSVNIFYE